MVPVLALSLVQNVSEDFIESSRKAVLAFDEGSWRMEAKTPEHAIETTILRHKEDRYTRVAIDGTVVMELSEVAGRSLYVDETKGTYSMYPASPVETFSKPGSDELIGENEFKFIFSPERGFRLILHPALANAQVKSSDGRETLTGDLKNTEGEVKGTLSYVRDAKTKLPIGVTLQKSDAKVTFRLTFFRRDVAPQEMTIPADLYQDYRKIESPQRLSVPSRV